MWLCMSIVRNAYFRNFQKIEKTKNTFQFYICSQLTTIQIKKYDIHTWNINQNNEY